MNIDHIGKAYAAHSNGWTLPSDRNVRPEYPNRFGILHDPSPPLEWMDLPVWTTLTRAMAPELGIRQKVTVVEVIGPLLDNLQDTQAHEDAQDDHAFSVDMELFENENRQA